MLTDNHGRIINYLRLGVTDRCNLRCAYCMPEEGIDWLSKTELMTYEEMLRLCSLLAEMGIQKIRITGGEPFIRKEILSFLAALTKLRGIQEISVTTNGVLTAPFVPELKKIGIHSINLSLDTLDRNRFISITHRDELSSVLKTLEELLKNDIAIKINAVVMEGHNIADIIPLAGLTKNLPVSVRFIEEMPFNGGKDRSRELHWDHLRILRIITREFPTMQKMPDPPNSTSCNYHIPGYRGNIGIIAAYTRTFCGTCNRLRITPQGRLKACLYDDDGIDLKKVMREGINDKDLKAILISAISRKEKDGWKAEKMRSREGMVQQSMASIGG
jgi:molybdenum cofactor biosynthesis protein A